MNIFPTAFQRHSIKQDILDRDTLHTLHNYTHYIHRQIDASIFLQTKTQRKSN
jgi:hypothetical protein